MSSHAKGSKTISTKYYNLKGNASTALKKIHCVSYFTKRIPSNLENNLLNTG